MSDQPWDSSSGTTPTRSTYVEVWAGKRRVWPPPTMCAVHRDIYDEQVPAVYLWTSKANGNDVPLCVPCCALWRYNAAQDPDLLPLRLKEIHEPHRDSSSGSGP